MVPRSVWQASGETLTPEQPLTLTHRRDDGMNFSLTYSVDDQYLISITAEAVNSSGAADMPFRPHPPQPAEHFRFLYFL